MMKKKNTKKKKTKKEKKKKIPICSMRKLWRKIMQKVYCMQF
jgi:hypothetical protein